MNLIPSNLPILASLLLLGALPRIGSAQAPSTAPGCTLNGNIYTCSRVLFQRALTDARTVSIDMSPRDRNGRAQLETLAGELGKAVAQPGQPADLTFALTPVDTEGVHVGPAGYALATLSVYAPGPNGPRSTLVWSDTFSGQPDMRWPAVVHALIQQFRAEFQKRAS